ncbi:hypothetical protein PVAG01_02749 [Phlyctema vagabunda]|uniref:Uncharacterized protein n=1 Tax=Phlyctema vagabunda TaxID=108571 RepID=A0ABR4PRG8_9HELO
MLRCESLSNALGIQKIRNEVSYPAALTQFRTATTFLTETRLRCTL